MATRDVTDTDDRSYLSRGRSRTSGYGETKPSFKTTELVVLVVSVVAVLIAAASDDSLDGRWAWTLVTALSIGYMLSRGIAKAGSRHFEDDESARSR